MTESIRPPSVDVEVEVEINRDLDQVATANDPSNAPEWYANISQVEWQTPPPVQVGSQVSFVARFLGRELRYTYEVVECGSSGLVMRTAHGPFPMETSYRYSPTAGGQTRVSLRNRGNPSGLFRVLAPLVAMAMRRANRKDLEALKQRLEP